MTDELQRSKRVLDEKHYETLRLTDENGKKNDHNQDLRLNAQDLEREIEMHKI